MLIDLSFPIQPHWRYGFKSKQVSSFQNGDAWQITEFLMRSHWFSHIDFPRHTGLEYPDSEAFSLEAYNGKASVINVNREQIANYGITAADLQLASNGRKLEKILLIRSDWGLETSWETKEFWSNSPYLTDDAIYWILDQQPTAVGFDFPQDYSIRLLQERPVSPEEQKTHTILLRNNILLIEYLTNFHSIKGDSCEFFCLPLNLKHVDGCPVRVVVRNNED